MKVLRINVVYDNTDNVSTTFKAVIMYSDKKKSNYIGHYKIECKNFNNFIKKCQDIVLDYIDKKSNDFETIHIQSYHFNNCGWVNINHKKE